MTWLGSARCVHFTAVLIVWLCAPPVFAQPSPMPSVRQTGEQAGTWVRSFCAGTTATWLSPEKPTVLEFDGIEYPISPLEATQSNSELLLAVQAERQNVAGGDEFVCKWLNSLLVRKYQHLGTQMSVVMHWLPWVDLQS